MIESCMLAYTHLKGYWMILKLIQIKHHSSDSLQWYTQYSDCQITSNTNDNNNRLMLNTTYSTTGKFVHYTL